MNQIKEKIHADTISKRNGVYTAKWSYFYRHHNTAEKYAEMVKNTLKANIVECGDHWHPFVGGATTGGPQDSYFWVKFRL